MNKKFKKIIIATGGTGGHVVPAYSLAKHLVDSKINIMMTIDKRGMQYLKEFSDFDICQITSATISKKNIFSFFFFNFNYFVFYI